ncbi:unnamed protein product, partial [Mesorhabditis belari]|uniref:Uncharacterized protein n=1 Tax=Mesorhabditis belari TaxID=2138241 RepID=A0AAF3EVY6_9BILA
MSPRGERPITVEELRKRGFIDPNNGQLFYSFPNASAASTPAATQNPMNEVSSAKGSILSNFKDQKSSGKTVELLVGEADEVPTKLYLTTSPNDGKTFELETEKYRTVIERSNQKTFLGCGPVSKFPFYTKS